MHGAQYFIEVFTSKDKVIHGVLSEMKHLERNLKLTANSTDLKSIVTWRIKLKPGVKIENSNQAHE